MSDTSAFNQRDLFRKKQSHKQGNVLLGLPSPPQKEEDLREIKLTVSRWRTQLFIPPLYYQKDNFLSYFPLFKPQGKYQFYKFHNNP